MGNNPSWETIAGIQNLSRVKQGSQINSISSLGEFYIVNIKGGKKQGSENGNLKHTALTRILLKLWNPHLLEERDLPLVDN